MPTYDVKIRMLVTKTYRVTADNEDDAIGEAHENASILLEDDIQEDYEEETLSTTLVARDKDPISKREALELSRQLWEQVAKLPDDEITKSDAKAIALEAMGWEPNDVLNHCFACEYTRDPDTDSHDCTECPVDVWRAKSNHSDDVPCVYAEYGEFTDSADTPRQRRAAARKISKLMRTD